MEKTTVLENGAIPTALAGGAPLPTADEFFASFADQTRMRILNALTVGEFCVTDLADLLDLPQTSVSRHLTSLRKANLVEVRRHGRFAWYSLAIPEDEFHREIIDCVHRCFAKVPALAEERLAASESQSSRSTSV
jgi:ArsR family transcriptional regulator